jgi:hypothetical protein
MKSQIYKLVSSKFNWVKTLYKALYGFGNSTGMPLGLPIAAIGKILWYDNRNANQVLIGLIIGNHKDKIARNENRVL